MEQIISKNHVKISLLIKLISLIASVYGIIMTTILDKGVLNFSYYTILSNITIDIALLIFIVFDVIYLKTGKNHKTNGMYIYKYVMTVCITVTFIVYLGILAPFDRVGFINSYLKKCAGSLCVHFIGPVCAILDYILFDYNFKSKKKHIFYPIFPAFIYIILVLILSGLGVRWREGIMSGPYTFLNFGAKTGWFGWDLSIMGRESLGIGVAYILVVLFIIFCLLGFLFLKIKDIRRKFIEGK